MIFQNLLVEILAYMRQILVPDLLIHPGIQLILLLKLFLDQFLIYLFKLYSILLDIHGVAIFYKISALLQRKVATLMQMNS